MRIPGQNDKEIAKSPFVERLLQKGYEVLYLTDVLDEYVMQHMTEYDDKKFADASKDELKMRDQDEKESKRDKVRTGMCAEVYTALNAWRDS